MTSRYIHTVDTALIMAADSIAGYIQGLLDGVAFTTPPMRSIGIPESRRLHTSLDRQILRRLKQAAPSPARPSWAAQFSPDENPLDLSHRSSDRMRTQLRIPLRSRSRSYRSLGA